MIIVSAATGQFGRLVVERLLERMPAAEVAVAVRNPAKAADLVAQGVQARYADYDQPATLRPAFEGADRLLFISAPDGPTRVRQHGHVVAAARDAGVGTLAYTSGLGADVTEDGVLGEHHATELAILDSGISYTILRHPIYSDFFFHPGLQVAIDAGELASSTGDSGLNTATRADLAEAAAAVLTGADRSRHIYNFTGGRWTYPELAAALTNLSGRHVAYREMDHDEGIMQMIGPAIRAGAFELQTADLEQILGRPTTSLQQAVAAALNVDHS